MTDISKLKLPEDTVIDTHAHGNDLYIIYVRTILRIPNHAGGNMVPEEAHTLEMQDYYSYEYPQMIDTPDGRLWCHIGGRLFRWEERQSRWAEIARFPMEKLISVNDSEMIFQNHLQYDENPHGTKSYNYLTGELRINN